MPNRQFQTKSKFRIAMLLGFAAGIATIASLLIKKHYAVNTPDFLAQIEPLTPNNSLTAEDKSQKSKIPNPKTSIFLPVPFTPQAPTANWDELHNEACEEASALMAAAFLIGLPPFQNNGERQEERLPASDVSLDPELVEAEIQKLTDWQNRNFGYHLSVNTEETARMIQAVYGLKTEILENFTVQDIKKPLAGGKLILLPANGQLLGNPYYKRPGPVYHMLVIKGYDRSGNFITNDPGTRRGLNYPYAFETLRAANGDWNHDEKKVDLNKKRLIVVWK